MGWQMKQVWSDAELNEHWLLTQEDYKLLRSKTELSRLALALQLKHYQFVRSFSKSVGRYCTQRGGIC